MLTEAETPGTDDWYAVQLATELGAGFPRLNTLRKYREGDAPVPDDAEPAMREAYKRVVKRGRLHLCDLIVGSKINRMKPVAFKTAAVGDDLGDTLAWTGWKASNMPVGVKDWLADAGHYGAAYITTTADGLMIPSNGWTSLTRQSSLRPWMAEAGIHVGYDPINQIDTITLFRPGYVRTAFKPTKTTTIPTDGTVWNPGREWTWLTGPQSTSWTQDVPMVKYQTADGMGVYEKHLDTLDRINDGIKDRLTITAMQAFRQRAIKGDLPTHYPDGHELAGEPVDYNELFKAGPAALWMLPEGADIWESAVTDITPLSSATKDDIKMLASATATPLYALSAEAAAGSAEGADVMRETHIYSVEDLADRAEGAFALVFSLFFQAIGDAERAVASEIETSWGAFKRHSLSEMGSGAAQAKAGGMTQRHIDEKIFGLTPAEMRQARQDREDEGLFAPAGDATPAFTAPNANAAPAAAPAEAAPAGPPAELAPVA